MSRIAMIRPLAARDFRLLWTGQTVSYVGDGVFQVALAWQVLELSGRPAALSLVLAARSVPMLVLLLLGGVISDRLPRRLVLIVSDLTRGTAAMSLAFLAATDALELWHVVAIAAVFGAADAFFYPAATAIMPDLLPTDELLRASALESASRPLAFQMAGPALGGIVVATLGTPAAFGIDAATFAISTFCVWLMRALPSATSVRRGVFREIAEGYRYARSQPWIWVTLIVAAFSILFGWGTFQVLLPVIARERLHGGAETYGLVLAAGGIGSILAALASSQFGAGRKRVTAMYLAFTATGVLFGAMALPRQTAVTAALSFLVGVCTGYGGVVWSTLLNQLVPRHLLGRVRSLDFLLSFALLPVSFAIAGPVAEAAGAVPTLAIGGLISGAVFLPGLFWPGVRDPERKLGEGRPSDVRR